MEFLVTDFISVRLGSTCFQFADTCFLKYYFFIDIDIFSNEKLHDPLNEYIIGWCIVPFILFKGDIVIYESTCRS